MTQPKQGVKPKAASVDLAQLLTDLKAAKRGSNKLDGRLEVSLFVPSGMVKAARLNNASTKVIYTYNDGKDVTGCADDLTTRVDAALRLLGQCLPGFDWIVGHTNGGLTVHAQVGPNEMVFGETPALALCIAIVEAKIKDATQ